MSNLKGNNTRGNLTVEYITKLVTTPVPRNTEAPHLGKNTDKVMLWQDFIVKASVGAHKYSIVVPKGYITDGSSIPRVLHRVWNPWYTEARWASVVHDYLYSDYYTVFSKKEADELFRTMLEHDGASKWTQMLFYRGVRLNFNGGGWE